MVETSEVACRSGARDGALSQWGQGNIWVYEAPGSNWLNSERKVRSIDQRRSFKPYEYGGINTAASTGE